MPRPSEPTTSQVMLIATMIFSTLRPTMFTAVPARMIAIAMEAICRRLGSLTPKMLSRKPPAA